MNSSQGDSDIDESTIAQVELQILMKVLLHQVKELVTIQQMG